MSLDEAKFCDASCGNYRLQGGCKNKVTLNGCKCELAGGRVVAFESLGEVCQFKFGRPGDPVR